MAEGEIKSCGVIVFRGDPVAEFLLMEHRSRLDLPKGHVDAGETDIECALRELEEETGIRRDDIELDPDFRFTTQYTVKPRRFAGREMNKTLVIFLGRLQRDVEIVTSEHPSYHWRLWDPPHTIQANTIDPLLSAVAEHWSRGD